MGVGGGECFAYLLGTLLILQVYFFEEQLKAVSLGLCLLLPAPETRSPACWNEEEKRSCPAVWGQVSDSGCLTAF